MYEVNELKINKHKSTVYILRIGDDILGTYLIRKTETGFVFHLKAANGENIGTSQVYMTNEDCRAGIENVRVSAGSETEDQTIEGYETLDNPKYEIYLDKADKFRFRLRSPDGENILVSQGYTAKASCKNGIVSVTNNAPDSEVIDDSLLSPEEEGEYEYAEQSESEAEVITESKTEETVEQTPSSCSCSCDETDKPKKKKFNWKFWKKNKD